MSHERPNFSLHNDLVTQDGKIVVIKKESPIRALVEVEIEQLGSHFVGLAIDKEDIMFNLKSALAQLGLHSETKTIIFHKRLSKVEVHIEITAYGKLAKKMLKYLEIGAYIGKLFAAAKDRRVRNEPYLTRMFGRTDCKGNPLLSFGATPGYDHLVLDKVDDRIVAFLPLEAGIVEYNSNMEALIPTLSLALKNPNFSLRELISLHQEWKEDEKRELKANEILLVKTAPLHICTAYAKVVNELLPSGFKHTSASVLQPDTKASGDIYELFGNSEKALVDIPLEFYTLEPYKEHVFFSDRDQLTACLDNPSYIFNAFKTMPKDRDLRCSLFIVKSNQLINLKTQDWVKAKVQKEEFPDDIFSSRRAALINRYVESQSSYPFLKALQDGEITSQGVMLSKYFPTPLLKRYLISEPVQRNLKGIYFQHPSYDNGDYFSHEDRALLADLTKHCIPVYWADSSTNLLLQYTHKPNKDSGMFVPMKKTHDFINATMIGVYGSNLLEGDFKDELTKLLRMLKNKKKSFNHPIMNEHTPLALVTGGGPGAMSIGNQVATELDILSCANIVDFSVSSQTGVLHEQHENPYIQAKMTYSLDKLVERQAEFHLDLPIFVIGGIGTDFELALEEVRRKVGSCLLNPILLFGDEAYWRDKITSRFQLNVKNGTIKGSEWVSNCFIVVKNAKEGFEVYQKFFTGNLPIGNSGPIRPRGFTLFSDL
ncbi:MAG: hypothetical protein P0S95_03415 [Rhabdochlamydiaceae bacterium]|nr:hypothetical protein [Candidatus Amphrikana amoebophyrae]